MAPGDIVVMVSEIASRWSNQLSLSSNSVGLSLGAYSCCMSNRRWQHVGLYGVLGLALVLVSGCIPESKPGFDSPSPSKRIDAIVDASGLEDDQSLVKLVMKLRSFAPAERMFAIRSLEIRTGETLGYKHGGHDWERIEAIGRWIEYLKDQGVETSELAQDKPDDGEAVENQPMVQGAD